MPVNSRLATAAQILCILARAGAAGSTAVIIARSLDTNPVVVRRMVKELAAEGLVHVQPGKAGGVRLARDAGSIALDAVHRAVDGPGSGLAVRPGGNPRCVVNRFMPDLLGPVFAEVDHAVVQALARTTIAMLAAQLPARGALA